MARSKGKQTWYLPGGTREEGENDLTALRREIQEELGVNIVENTLTKYGVIKAQAHGKSDGVMVQITCYSAEIDGDPEPNNEVDELAFFSYSDKDKITDSGKILFDELRDKELIA